LLNLVSRHGDDCLKLTTAPIGLHRYISPITMRRRMAELFRDSSCIRWWLPNDDGFTPIIQNVRAFADERNATAVSAQGENVRQIRNVFSKMHIGPPVDAGLTGGN